MGEGSRDIKPDAVDLIVLILSIALVFGLPALALWLLPAFDFETLSSISTQLSEVAGLVAALSLAGLAIAGGTGRARQILSRHSTVFSVFFAFGYLVVVILALLLTFAPALVAHVFALRALVYLTSSTLLTMTTLTSFVLFGLFRASSEPEETPPPRVTRRPYGANGEASR